MLYEVFAVKPPIVTSVCVELNVIDVGVTIAPLFVLITTQSLNDVAAGLNSLPKVVALYA